MNINWMAVPYRMDDVIYSWNLSIEEKSIFFIICFSDMYSPHHADGVILLSRRRFKQMVPNTQWRKIKRLLLQLQEKQYITIKFNDKTEQDEYDVGIEIYVPKKNKRKIISARKRKRILKRDRYTCQKCGKNPVENKDCELHIDHIIPVSKGGGSEDSNLQVLCEKCNLKKGAKIEQSTV